ncbi:MAG: Gfo/Idh/MocA family oxidoreductase [Chloroflexi bacterium]|nr:Gfo/Idh/MocA family oxidoreductase [Chloroflexota bacterium]
MAERVRVGFVGLGHNGCEHIRQHLKVGKSEIAALCDVRKDRLERAVSEFGVTRLYDSFLDLCRDPELDAVSINTGDAFHKEPFLAALEAGKHVLIEKPVANTEKDILTMVEAAKSADPQLKIQVGYILRFMPVYEAIHQAASSGQLGDIYYMEGDYIHNLLYQAEQTDPHTGTNWYLEEEIPMVGGGSHPLDLLRWFSGNEVVSVSAYSNHVAFPAMRHDDCQVALYRFDDRTIAKVAALYAPRCEMAHFYNVRLYGTRGTVDRDSKAISESPEDVHPSFVPLDVASHLSAFGELSGHPFAPEIEDWLDAIVEDRSPRISLVDGASSCLAALMAVRAAREGREIDVPQLC